MSLVRKIMSDIIFAGLGRVWLLCVRSVRLGCRLYGRKWQFWRVRRFVLWIEEKKVRQNLFVSEMFLNFARIEIHKFRCRR